MTLLAQPIALNDKPRQTAPVASMTLSLELTSFCDGYLALAERVVLTNDDETRHKSEKPLHVSESLPLSTALNVCIEKTPTTEVFVIRRPAGNTKAKYLTVFIGLVCGSIFFMCMQDYLNSNNSKRLETALPAFVMPITQSPAMIMRAKHSVKTPSSIESLILPKSLLADDVATKVPVKSKLQIETNLNNIMLASPADDEVLNVVDKSTLTARTSDAVLPSSSKYRLKKSFKDSQVKLISHMSTTAVDESLIEAYQALNHSEYALAQQQYQQVLLRDARNVDALLGMAVIAQQQGRDADAQAWNQKILEVEPRNAIALSMIANHQTDDDSVATVSRLKSMLTQQPEAASFHAALGNLYANQNQWTSAQEAFFNACHFAPNNADYAFNMAISLDHMAKYNLALEQYQRALKLLNLSDVSSPDRGKIESRIKSLLSFNVEK